MENDGFRILKDAFDKFAGKFKGKDVGGRAVRAAAAGGKAAVDRGLQEYPKTFIKQMAKDVYDFISSQEVADGISTTVRTYDEEKVKELVDGLAAKLKDRDTALNLAKQVKSFLAKSSADDIEGMIDGLLDKSNVPMGQRMIFTAFFAQAKPMIEEMKNASEEEVADKIMELADNIPSDMIAAQVGALTREVTPERVSRQTHDFVGGLPSPQAVSDIVHGIGKTASEQLDKLSKITSTSEVKDIVSDFSANARDVVADTLAKDAKAKKTFKPKGQDFDL